MQSKDYPAPRKTEYFFLMITFRLLMDYMYRNVVATTYAYMGFDYHPGTEWMILSWALLCVGARLLFKAYKNEVKRVSFEVILLLFLMSFVPFTSMVAYGALPESFTIANSVFWLLLMLFSITFSKKRPLSDGTAQRERVGLGDFQIKCLAVFFGLVVIYVSGKYAHFRFNLDILNVYEFRAEASSNNLPLWLSYVFAWSRTINTVIIAYFLRQRKLGWTVASCVVQLLSFGYDGSKSTLFLLVLAVGVGLLPRFEMRTMNKWMLRGITALAVLLVLHFMITRNFVLISILIRRVFYLPVRIAKDYFDYFTTHQPDFFRQSFLRYFGMKSPYAVSIPHLIGDVYFDAPEMSANNGLIADAITNLGYAGLVVFPVFYSSVLKLLDKASSGLDPRIFITVGIYLSLVMTNSFMFTILLTHGLIVAMIVLRFMKRDRRTDTADLIAILEGEF